MHFARRVHGERMLRVDITSMIDVVFLLIIFFMTTARFVQVTRAELELPRERGEQREEREQAGIVVNIDAAGAIIVGQERITIDELERLVRSAADRQREEAPKLLVRADRRADSARLNEVVALLRRLGVGVARLATEVPE